MLQFKPITIEDKNTITAFTQSNTFLNCDFAFSNMCSWRFLYDSEFAVEDDFLYIRFFLKVNNKQHRAYMLPLGKGDLQQAVEKIENDASLGNHPLLIFGVTADSKNLLEKLFPGAFTFDADRTYFDYIYLREDLKTLKGKKYQPKRNHINKFNKKYSYTYAPITPDMIPECLALEQKWMQANLNEEDMTSIQYERRSLTFALSHFRELELTGGAIIVDNEIIAFTYGSAINNYTFGVHVEKADIQYDGIFSVINQAFAAHLPEQYLYINREEDMGLPGLRQAKLSYQPVILLEKNKAFKRR
ncbi:MAG: phosphatidylglycerol lysyltransferase domain-containing protein [Tannerella sp.]|nr:phosphatidylglycerol lysyltransferase domain-containing protein [Tannerella sp.]